jgi:hypothetical protein
MINILSPTGLAGGVVTRPPGVASMGATGTPRAPLMRPLIAMLLLHLPWAFPHPILRAGNPASNADEGPFRAHLAIASRGLATSGTCGQYFGAGGTGSWTGTTTCTSSCAVCACINSCCSMTLTINCAPGNARMGNATTISCGRCQSLCSYSSYGWNDQGVVCVACVAGSYCTGGTALPVQCPAGRYGATTGLTASTCS